MVSGGVGPKVWGLVFKVCGVGLQVWGVGLLVGTQQPLSSTLPEQWLKLTRSSGSFVPT